MPTPTTASTDDDPSTRPGLLGQVALVTGAGRRVGRAIALELARGGADVVVHVNRSVDEGEAVAGEIRERGRRAAVVQGDQRDPEQIRAACDAAEVQLGGIDLLVNSAAIWPQTRFGETDPAEFDLAVEVNLRGPFFWSQTLGTRMRARGAGAIVSIADVAFERPFVDSLPYCMAKAGIVSMTYGLAKALAPQVRVNAIGPGPIVFPPDYPEASAAADRAATLRGSEGAPEDIARAVRFLAESPNITGALLPVDGGYRFGI